MKKNDLVLIILITGIAVIVAVIVGNSFITTSKNRSQKVEVVDRFSTDFPTPDVKVFNDQALDPTKDIKIGPATNDQPFKNQGK